MAAQTTDKRLYRSRDAYLGGVCAGIAERFDLDPIVVRILALLLVGLTLGLAAIVYIALWVRLPRAPEPEAPYDVTPESAESHAYGNVDYARSLATADDRQLDQLPVLARVAIAVGLMLLFLAVSVNLTPLVSGTRWWQFWPIAFLIAGLCLIIIPIPRFEAFWHAAGIVVTSLAASVLPMSLGVVSWRTIPYAFELLWPIVVLAIVLLCVGAYRKINALVLAGAFCIVAFCLIGSTLCMLPGETEVLMLHMPTGHEIKLGFMR